MWLMFDPLFWLKRVPSHQATETKKVQTQPVLNRWWVQGNIFTLKCIRYKLHLMSFKVVKYWSMAIDVFYFKMSIQVWTKVPSNIKLIWIKSETFLSRNMTFFYPDALSNNLSHSNHSHGDPVCLSIKSHLLNFEGLLSVSACFILCSLCQVHWGSSPSSSVVHLYSGVLGRAWQKKW